MFSCCPKRTTAIVNYSLCGPLTGHRPRFSWDNRKGSRFVGPFPVLLTSLSQSSISNPQCRHLEEYLPV
jgi:hypothetical protein